MRIVELPASLPMPLVWIVIISEGTIVKVVDAELELVSVVVTEYIPVGDEGTVNAAPSETAP